MNITIYGAGYVGLVTGTCLASLGHDVLCVDNDIKKVAQLEAGHIPIYEPGLEALLQSVTIKKQLRFSHNAKDGVDFASLQMIAVNTPTTPNEGADIRNILQVAKTIAEQMTQHKLIINKSTAPPGTVHKIKQTIEQVFSELKKEIPFTVASNPEFLKEGTAISDFMKPDRIIIGLDDLEMKKFFLELYHPFIGKLLFMECASAELSKYAANAILATKISFMNELAGIAEKVDADIEAVKLAIGLDPRIGPHFINPGCGYGGSCFPKDVKALAHFAQKNGIVPVLLNAVEEVNDTQKKILAQKILKYFNFNIQNKIIGLWGLAFKPNTNDMREASSIILMKMLWESGAIIRAYDPIALDVAKNLFHQEITTGKLILCLTATQVLEQADVLAIVTEWDEFRNFTPEHLYEYLHGIPVFDGRNLYDTKEMHARGIKYFSVGR